MRVTVALHAMEWEPLGDLSVDLQIDEDHVVRIARDAIHRALADEIVKQGKAMVKAQVQERAAEYIKPRLDAIFQRVIEELDAKTDDELMDFAFETEHV